MQQFEEVRKKALELYKQEKLSVSDHALERMIERNIFYEDIEAVLRNGSFYKQVVDDFGDTRYSIRGVDSENKSIRIVFTIKEDLIIITVIREQEEEYEQN